MDYTEVRLKDFPADLWALVRIRAAERRVTMKAIVVEALTEHLNRRKE